MMMTGAKRFIGGDNMLSFNLPGNITKDHGNAMTIELNASDTYTMRFSRTRKQRRTVLAVHENIYNDQLQAIFTEVTGLATHL